MYCDVSERSPLITPCNETKNYKQQIIVDEEVTLSITGFKISKLKQFFFYFFSVITFGFVYLISRWFPKLELKFTSIPSPLGEATLLLTENNWHQFLIVSITTITVADIPMSHIFPNYVAKVNPSHSDTLITELKSFEYRYFKLIFNPLTQKFDSNCNWRDLSWNSVEKCLEGVNGGVIVLQRQKILGENTIDIKEKPTMQLLIDEVLHPFYVFQIASIFLWSLDDYYYYAFCIFVISTSSAISTLVETKQTMKRMRDLAHFSCEMRVWRGGAWWRIDSGDAVPGDIFEVTPATLPQLPCDAFLLDGDCIVNESMLTGESVPVSKTSANDEDLASIDYESNDPIKSNEISRYFLFGGTKVIRSRAGKFGNGNNDDGDENDIGANGCLAMVARIGFNTTKGSLVRSMMFPKPNNFQFYRDSFRFIGVLGIIASLGFLASFYNFIMLKVDPVMIFVRALDLITIVIPPALPATMAIGTSFAITRLKLSKIFCISPPRVNISGKIGIMCFDKTGTLTEDGLDVLGFRETTKDINSMSSENDRVSLNEFSKLYKTATLLENKNSEFPYPLIICAMGVCHSIKVVNGQVMGDPMDLKMFEFTNWNIDELDASSKITTDQRVRLKKMSLQNVVGTIVSPPYDKTFPESNIFTEFGVIKSFEFVSGLRRMSVIVRRISYIKETFTFQAKVKQPDLTNKMNTSTGKDFEIFVKGAPEVIKDICLKDSIPFNYDELLRHYAHSGYRVIAFAYKKLVNISFLKIMKAKRGDVEKELTFLGFIIFENKLKAGTADIVKILNQAKIRQVMCTGDNVLTAVSVSRICDLVNIQNKIFIPSIAEREIHRNENSKIIWEDIEGSNIFLDPKTLLPPFPSRSSNFENSPIPFKYDLAVTGDIFQHILDYGSEDLLNKVLIKCQIFARMSPEQKHLLVEHLQALGCCVGFCGDGANDCGALKAADVGISLSEAEASVAAPFTSQVTHIECVPTLIREGRAALVTSFSCFKYMAIYSLIQFTSVSILYSLGGNLGDFQFLFIDLALIIPVATTMARAEAHEKLDKKKPTARLVSKRVLSSLIGQTFICVFLQFWIFFWVRDRLWYVETIPDVDAKRFKCHENTVIFFLSSYQYLITSVLFSVGPPYRKALYKNTAFVVTASILLTVMLYLNFIPHEIVLSQLDLMVIPLSGKIYVFGLAMCNFVLCWLGEVFLFPKISDFIGYLDLVRVCYNLRKSEAYKKDFLDEEVALVPNNNNFSNEGIQIENKNKEKEFFRNEAKILHWKSKNKIFKIVDFRFKEEIQNLIALH